MPWKTVIGLAIFLSPPLCHGAELNKCNEGGKVVYQDEPCPETIQKEADQSRRDASRRREVSRVWDERMRLQREELARKPLPAEALIPWSPGETDERLDDRLGTSAAVIGRAAACGVDTSRFASNVKKDIDSRYATGSSAQKQRVLAMQAGISLSSDMQAKGQTPDSCDAIRSQYNRIPGT